MFLWNSFVFFEWCDLCSFSRIEVFGFKFGFLFDVVFDVGNLIGDEFFVG